MQIRGARVLLLEDDALISIDAEEMLLELGVGAVHVCHTLAEAEAIVVRETIDAAMLDIRIGAHRSDGLARDLLARGIPFIFTSGYGPDARQIEGLEAVPAVGKPYAAESLTAAFGKLVQNH